MTSLSSCRSGFDSFSVTLDFCKFSCRFGNLCHALLYFLWAHLHHGGNKTRDSNPVSLFSVVRINSHEIFCNCMWLQQFARFHTMHLQNGCSPIRPLICPPPGPGKRTSDILLSFSFFSCFFAEHFVPFHSQGRGAP